MRTGTREPSVLVADAIAHRRALLDELEACPREEFAQVGDRAAAFFASLDKLVGEVAYAKCLARLGGIIDMATVPSELETKDMVLKAMIHRLLGWSPKDGLLYDLVFLWLKDTFSPHVLNYPELFAEISFLVNLQDAVEARHRKKVNRYGGRTRSSQGRRH